MRTPVRPAHLLPLVLALLAAACGRPEPLEPATEQTLPLLQGGGAATTRTDPAEIVAARIAGDRLHLEVRYGGGCREHDFSLRFDGAFRESFPVQADLRLAHDAHADPCRALLTQELVLDLAPLKERYREAYRSATGTIVLSLYAPAATQPWPQPLRYDF